jgi:hypothetical protein
VLSSMIGSSSRLPEETNPSPKVSELSGYENCSHHLVEREEGQHESVKEKMRGCWRVFDSGGGGDTRVMMKDVRIVGTHAKEEQQQQ